MWNPNTMDYKALGFINRQDKFPFTRLGKSDSPQGETNDALGRWLHEKCLSSFSGIKSALERLRW